MLSEEKSAFGGDNNPINQTPAPSDPIQPTPPEPTPPMEHSVPPASTPQMQSMPNQAPTGSIEPTPQMSPPPASGKSKSKWILIILALLVIVAGIAFGGFLFMNQNKTQDSAAVSPTPDPGAQVACTMEAKLCPDGVTYVGRSGPKCEFQTCPTESASSSAESATESDGSTSGEIIVHENDKCGSNRVCDEGLVCQYANNPSSGTCVPE